MAGPIPTRTLGSERLRVGAVGYGAMSFADVYGQSGYDKDASARVILNRAAALGVTLIDTADVYGPSEEILGRALAGHRGDFVVATKFGIRLPTEANVAPKIDGTRAYMRQQLDQSLRRLALITSISTTRTASTGHTYRDTVGWMAELVAEGKVRHLACPRPLLTRCAGRTASIRSPRCRPNGRCGSGESRTRSSRQRGNSASPSSLGPLSVTVRSPRP